MRAARTFALGSRPTRCSPTSTRSRPSCSARWAPPATATAATRPCCWAWSGRARRPSTADTADERVAAIRAAGSRAARRAPRRRSRLTLHRRTILPFHPNGMRFTAYDPAGRACCVSRIYYSVGGGFVVDEDATGADRIRPDDTPLPYPFSTGAELLGTAKRPGLQHQRHRCSRTRRSWRTEDEIRAGLLQIWRVMRECVARLHDGGRAARRPEGQRRRAPNSSAEPASPAPRPVAARPAARRWTG